MKRILKVLVLIIILSTTRIKGVKAESFYEDNWISGVYANLIDGDFSKPQLMRFIRRKSDNKASYCITPRVLLYEDEIYNTSNVNLSEEQKKRIEMLSYFGYGYGNHTSNEWYAITQFMIWKTVEPNMDIFFTDKFKGNRITRFTDEINELEYLIKQYDIVPNINISNVSLNKSYQIEDTNKVLNNYKLISSNEVDASIQNNILNIKSGKPGNHTLNLIKEYNLYNNNPSYYSASRGQQILVPGNLDAVKHKIDINVSKANIVLTKKDIDTGELLEGADYGIFDYDYNYMYHVLTNEKGEILFENLDPGRYYLIEINSPKGYQEDLTYYGFDVDEEYEYINFTNEKIKANVYLYKYISDDIIIKPEKDIEFEIYDLENNYINSIITNNDGEAVINLVYGKYKIHQVNTTDGYQKVDDFYVEINDIEDKKFYLSDKKIEEKPISLNINELEEKDLIKPIKKEEIFNPKTCDINIYIYIIVGYISFIILLYIIASIKSDE